MDKYEVLGEAIELLEMLSNYVEEDQDNQGLDYGAELERIEQTIMKLRKLQHEEEV